MRIRGELGGVLVAQAVGRRGGKERRGLNGVRGSYRVGVGVKGVGKGRRQHPGGSERGKSFGIKGGRENVRELAGHEGVEVIVRIYRARNWVGDGGGSS